jgi:hypothetical protein
MLLPEAEERNVPLLLNVEAPFKLTVHILLDVSVVLAPILTWLPPERFIVAAPPLTLRVVFPPEVLKVKFCPAAGAKFTVPPTVNKVALDEPGKVIFMAEAPPVKVSVAELLD